MSVRYEPFSFRTLGVGRGLVQKGIRGLRMGLIPLTVLSVGCETGPNPIVIHQDPQTLVRLDYDPRAGTGHHHPFHLSPGQVATILRGIWVEDRNTIVGFDLFGHRQEKPAFSNAEISKLATLLSQGLRIASPMDVVTFFILANGGDRGVVITSGGLFVRDEDLYCMLANWRSVPSENSASIVSATELNYRDYPLQSIGFFGYRVGFSPKQAWLANDREKVQVYPDPAKVVVIDLHKVFQPENSPENLPAR